MAADTRPYKSKEQDGQGNEVIIRDQQLVEQSTVTTMPSGACFETLDIDGRPVKIPRDNMMSIVLECIGIVLNDSSKNLGTNVNKALGLQGNTIGNVTVNDFASVLGGQGITGISSSTDLNSYSYKDGISAFCWGDTPVNAPYSYCFMLNIHYGTRNLQIVVAYDSSQQFYYRSKDGTLWREWRVIDSHTK